MVPLFLEGSDQLDDPSGQTSVVPYYHLDSESNYLAGARKQELWLEHDEVVAQEQQPVAKFELAEGCEKSHHEVVESLGSRHPPFLIPDTCY